VWSSPVGAEDLIRRSSQRRCPSDTSESTKVLHPVAPKVGRHVDLSARSLIFGSIGFSDLTRKGTIFDRVGAETSSGHLARADASPDSSVLRHDTSAFCPHRQNRLCAPHRFVIRLSACQGFRSGVLRQSSKSRPAASEAPSSWQAVRTERSTSPATVTYFCARRQSSPVVITSMALTAPVASLSPCR
jgi:hypothetical protein